MESFQSVVKDAPRKRFTVFRVGIELLPPTHCRYSKAGPSGWGLFRHKCVPCTLRVLSRFLTPLYHVLHGGSARVHGDHSWTYPGTHFQFIFLSHTSSLDASVFASRVHRSMNSDVVFHSGLLQYGQETGKYF